MLIDYFDRGAMLAKDSACLIDGGTGHEISYTDVREMTLQGANALLSEGFGPGTRGAVLATNDGLAFVCTLAIARSGTAWIPLNPRNSVQDNARILADFDCDVLFYLSAFTDLVTEIRSLSPAIRRFICIDCAQENDPAFLDWISLSSASEVHIPHDMEGVAAIQPTGGTTGRPKGVMMTHRGFQYIVANFMAVAPCRERPVFLAATPMTHAAGVLAQYILTNGGKIVILPDAAPGNVLAAIPRWKVTHLPLVPTVLYRLMADPDIEAHDYSSLQFVGCGGSPASPDKIREAVEIFGPTVYLIYGQSESATPVTCLAPSEYFNFERREITSPELLSSCGRATPFTRVAIMDDEGQMLPVNEAGEIAIRSSGVMKGYYNNPQATDETIIDGWLRTGDIGTLDEDGFCRIVDRKKDMIITGGFNVFSSEVEAVVLSHSAVKDCSVIGVPDDKWGEAVFACVELKSGRCIDADSIITLCKKRLGSVKAPKRVEFVDALPRSSVGKVLKRKLRDRFWQETDRKI